MTDASEQPERAGVAVVTGDKGGIGKTTTSFELAFLLDAVLVDLDHHSGGASRMWGYRPERFRRAPLLDGFEAGPGGKAPRPRSAPNRPRLVPSHRDLAALALTQDEVAECLLSWIPEWDTDVVVIDTPPGEHVLADAAISISDLVLVPVPLKPREMDALEGMLEFFSDYRLVLVPNMVPRYTPQRMLKRLSDLVAEHSAHTTIAPPISHHLALERRALHTPVSSATRGSAQVRAAQEELARLAAFVREALISEREQV